jgi:hypothetical protein
MMKKILPVWLAFVLAHQVSAQFSTPASTLERHVHTLASDSLLGRGFGTPQGSSAAAYIAIQMEEAGLEPLNGSYFHFFNHRQGILNIPGTNVVGIIPGSDPELREEYIVLGAHFDHLGWKIAEGDTVVYNGADDNASGTAAILEIGRHLAASRESLGRSIVIAAFDGEESGLIGSTWFVENSLVPPHQIKLMFSLDMVGMYEKNGGLDMVGVKLLTNYEEIVGELAGQYGITITKANKSIGQRTDTAPFGNIGIPAIHAYTGLESPYHKPEDTPSKLDYEGMAKVTDYVSAATLQLSRQEVISELPPLEEGQVSAKTQVFRPGVRFNMGSSHYNYREEPILGKSILAWEAGVFGNIQLARFLMLQPEVLYESKGSQNFSGNFRTHSLTTPLNLLLTTPDEGYVRFYLMLGGYYSYHFGGKAGDISMDFDTEFSPHEFGISYGVGMEAMNVQMGLYFQRGLSNLFQEPGNVDIVHQNIYFSLGFMF